jgi:chromosome segregation ATPase
MAITQDQIFEVADTLVSKGEKPTLVNVRRALGGGSFSTISEGMEAWRSARATVAEPLREPAPQIITDRLAAFGAELWAVAQEMATSRLTTEREALEAARAELEAARVEATDLADQLSAELEASQVRCAELVAVEDGLRVENSALHDQVVAHQERASAAEGRAADLTTALTEASELRQADARRIEALLQEVATLKEQGRIQQASQEKQDAELVKLASEVQSANQERNAAKEANALLRGETEALRRQVSEQLNALKSVTKTTKPTAKPVMKTQKLPKQGVTKKVPNGS